MRTFKALALCVLGWTFVKGSPQGLIPSFGLFNIVNFKNDQCTGVENNAATGLFGTCLSSTECSDKDGMQQGNCAAGFGVCCVFRQTGCAGVTVTQNGTYITNPSFPAVEPATPALDCDYTIDVPGPGSETCQVRLDFKDVVLTPGMNGFVADGTTPAGEAATSGMTVTTDFPVAPPRVSGTLTGQHMYVHISAANPVINIDKILTDANNKWEIRVDFIHCSSPWKAPEGCTQYYKENAGFVRSYNNDCMDAAAALQGRKELTGQDNRICIRKNAGFSNVQFIADGEMKFIVGDMSNIAHAGVGSVETEANGGCMDAEAAVIIPGADTFCQERLAPTAAQTANAPVSTDSFRLTHVSNALTAATAVADTTGFCIMYSQTS